MPLNIKDWLRSSLAPFWGLIKSFVTDQINQAKTDILNQVGSVTGTYKGSFATVASMPSSAKNGDWAILNVDDGANESGIYVKQSGGFQFITDLQTFQEIRTEILASDAESNAGTSSSKVLTVKQVTDKIAAALSAVEVSGKANLNGDDEEYFDVLDAQAGTKQAVNASQFGTTITLAEATSDFNGA